jgi:hypothetical protein
MSNEKELYTNIEHKMSGGNKVTRKVKIAGTKGYKSVCIYKNGNKCHSRRKKLSSEEMSKIKEGKFIPGLFSKLLEPKTRRRTKT